eukprot:2722693-Rhodomonas_salina.1
MSPPPIYASTFHVDMSPPPIYALALHPYLTSARSFLPRYHPVPDDQPARRRGGRGRDQACDDRLRQYWTARRTIGYVSTGQRVGRYAKAALDIAHATRSRALR